MVYIRHRNRACVEYNAGLFRRGTNAEVWRRFVRSADALQKAEPSFAWKAAWEKHLSKR